MGSEPFGPLYQRYQCFRTRTKSFEDLDPLFHPGIPPPVLGTGSEARGRAVLRLDTATNAFVFDLQVEGILAGELDNNHGENTTAVIIYKGTPEVRGPIVLDVHGLSLWQSSSAVGVQATRSGFRMRLEDRILQVQGERLDTGFTPFEIADFLLSGNAHIMVHSVKSLLTRYGEIRGNFRVSSEPVQPLFQRGDCNSDGARDISDAIFHLGALFAGESAPACLDACDSNFDGASDISDAVYLLAFLFSGGTAPDAPFPACDPAQERLGCREDQCVE